MELQYSEFIKKHCWNESINSRITNLTSSYIDKGNEASMVSSSLIIFVVAGLFFNLNLFRGLSDVSAILDPKVRLVLTSAVSLFLPVMSYLFSEAKNAGAAVGFDSSFTGVKEKDFSLRAGLILVWMLLVELLRKKVDDSSWRGYSGTIQRAGRVVWLGSLVFFNIQSVGRKVVFAVLWILCATKVVQRVAFAEVGKRSYLHGRNAWLITSYMAQTLKADRRREPGATATAIDVDVEGDVPSPSGEELLKRCKYIVTGEDKIVKEATADGYDLDLDSDYSSVATVGKIWMLGDDYYYEGGRLLVDLDGDQRLRRLCLSFALFKLLRRRFEQLGEITMEESRDCKNLILRGLCRCKNGEGSEEALFQVMNDELNLLCEYYHSVVPVVLASPFFFLTNYLLLPVLVFVLCLMTAMLCGNGDLDYVFHSIRRDNFALKSGLTRLAMCLLSRAYSSPNTFLSLVDLSITCLLFFIFFYEEIWELLVFLLSNWFMISLIGNYTSKLKWRESPSFGVTFRCLVWLQSKTRHDILCFRQFSVLNLRWPVIFGVPTWLSWMVQTVPVPTTVKQSIKEYLLAHEHYGHGITNGKSALEKNHHMYCHLSWACESKSVTEVILTWHIATSLFEERCPPQSKDGEASCNVATTLSKYCAYLVAFHPELLPDNQEKTERVFMAVKEELKDKLGCGEYYLSRWRTRVNKIMETGLGQGGGWTEKKMMKSGATLAKSLVALATNDQGAVWRVLADVWTELVIYVAPSRDEESIKGHQNVLVQGGEFVTMLWALATHIGLSRQASEPVGVHPAS
ncbi:uncharacterized protein LOC119320569 [Triticum dicoccoides]|uniref:uncharacterized protein LOC119320569 n=1 Tax=Triticum dicoccoides TaxID=85692 RepID=UPI0018916CB9|nr:uncharacterized protein LOC119320569 [Triticum dicoccoides]